MHTQRTMIKCIQQFATTVWHAIPGAADRVQFDDSMRKCASVFRTTVKLIEDEINANKAVCSTKEQFKRKNQWMLPEQLLEWKQKLTEKVRTTWQQLETILEVRILNELDGFLTSCFAQNLVVLLHLDLEGQRPQLVQGLRISEVNFNVSPHVASVKERLLQVSTMKFGPGDALLWTETVVEAHIRPGYVSMYRTLFTPPRVSQN